MTPVGWILAQLLIVQKFFVLQPIVLAAGAAILVLAPWTHRGASIRAGRA